MGTERISLADQLHEEGFYFYGPFFGNQELAKGLTPFAFDLIAKKITSPIKLITLEEAIAGQGYKGKVRESADRPNYKFSDVYLIYAIPKEDNVDKRKIVLSMATMHTTYGQLIALRNIPLKKK